MTYGYCPNCGSEGKARERSPNGKTFCKNGHAFLSAKWEEFNKTKNPQQKRKGWGVVGYGYIDFNEPVTYAEAEKEMKKMSKLMADKFPKVKQAKGNE